MLARALVAALTLICAPLSATALDKVALETRAPSADSVLRSIGFGDLFARFGQSIAASARQQGMTDERFVSAWEVTALEAFSDGRLDREFAVRVSAEVDPTDLQSIAMFLGSPFGTKVTALEHATQTVPETEKLGVIAKGQMLYWRISDRRRQQLDELMTLSGADVGFTMVAESLRGMAIGLHLSRADGDLMVPWAEIDAEVAAQLGGINESLTEAARAALAYTYEPLSDDELEAYLEFLRQPGTRKVYGAATLAIGDIIQRTLFGLGESLALRLSRVSI
jgi:hypothetical protein